MNRIAKYLKPAEKSPARTQTAAAPKSKTCSFCGSPLDETDFKAFSKAGGEIASICHLCIERFAVMAKFAINYKIFAEDEPNYMPLFERIMKRLSCEEGALKTKQIMTKHALRFLQRGSSLMAGHQKICPITNVSLLPARIALVGPNAGQAAKLLRIACAEAGISHMMATPSELKSGEAYKRVLETNANGEHAWAENSVIICDGYCPSFSSRIPVVMICDSMDENEIIHGICPISVG